MIGNWPAPLDVMPINFISVSYYIKHRSHVLVLGPPSVDFNQTWDLCWGPQVVLVLFWGQPCPEGLGPRGGGRQSLLLKVNNDSLHIRAKSEFSQFYHPTLNNFSPPHRNICPHSLTQPFTDIDVVSGPKHV